MTSITAEQPTVALPDPQATPADAPGRAMQLARDSLYLLLNMPMGTVAFTLLVTGWSTALSTIITFIGIPLVPR